MDLDPAVGVAGGGSNLVAQRARICSTGSWRIFDRVIFLTTKDLTKSPVQNSAGRTRYFSRFHSHSGNVKPEDRVYAWVDYRGRQENRQRGRVWIADQRFFGDVLRQFEPIACIDS